MRHLVGPGLVLILALACGREVVFVDPPPTSGGDTGSDTSGTDTTTVRRVDLVVTVQVAAADEALATRLGFVNGRVPDARVTARRVQGGQPLQADSTDAAGEATLVGLLEGTWAISVLRPLTDAERAVLDSADQDVTGFGGAVQVPVSIATRTAMLEALAGRQGTLVFSEIYAPNGELPKQSAQYIEVYNNSFETLYLDGKIIGRSMGFVSDGNFSCSASARWREDPAGIWTRLLWAFPGTGQTYPLPPGGTAVIATDAIDHGAILPGLLDLSQADFEFIGASDVDNPAVPNMVNFPGWSDHGDPIGHGPFWVSVLSIFLADPVHPDSLPVDHLPVVGSRHVRIPADRILDVVTSGSTPQTKTGPPWCAHFVHPSFDGGFAQLMTYFTDVSTARLSQGAPESRLLQRTRVSSADFAHRTPPTPGRVP